MEVFGVGSVGNDSLLFPDLQNLVFGSISGAEALSLTIFSAIPGSPV
jgi:hypothetical protein